MSIKTINVPNTTTTSVEKSTSNTWSNWAGNVQCSPEGIFYPKNEEEVQQLILTAANSAKHIRVVGSGHSFSKLIQTDSLIVSLDRMSGIIDLDKKQKIATVWAGTKLKDLGELLFEQGLAQENLGDIDVQSIAGATGTGTHGTGMQFGNLSTQITAFTIVTGTGEIIHCTKDSNSDLFNAGCISLGALGIITRIQLRLRTSYKLEYVSKKSTLEATLADLEKYNRENRNFEFYWMPYTNKIQHRFSNETDEPVKDNKIKKYFNQVILENTTFKFLCTIGTWFKSSFIRINKIIGTLVNEDRKINYSHRVYASLRRVKFKEMEYNIPLKHFPEVMRRVDALVRQEKHRVFFPVECRFVKGDDLWLSPAYQRDSAYMAFHVYYKTPHNPYFTDIEKLMMEYDGRPHWGKMHTRTAKNLCTTYPKWDDFQAIRKSCDPHGVFLNPYLKQVFGV
ncbi:MAG: FAD-binding protein [Saprospiraceae bacterium]|nr:FAD-binding protein [Saprospiraceae bacterium]